MSEQEAARPREISQEITFKTAAKAPGDFNAWTFFWSMPQIDDDAELDYVVIQPDGGCSSEKFSAEQQKNSRP